MALEYTVHTVRYSLGFTAVISAKTLKYSTKTKAKSTEQFTKLSGRRCCLPYGPDNTTACTGLILIMVAGKVDLQLLGRMLLQYVSVLNGVRFNNK